MFGLLKNTYFIPFFLIYGSDGDHPTISHVIRIIETPAKKTYSVEAMDTIPSVNQFLTHTWKFLYKKVFLLGVVVLILVIGGIVFFLNTNTRSGYVFDQAKKTDLTEVVTESGTISSDGNVPVYSPTTGTLSKVYVTNEQQIQAGQQLFTVVSSATEQEKQAAYAAYLAAKAAVDNDKAMLLALQANMFTLWQTYTDLATSSTYENSDKSPNTVSRTSAEFKSAEASWLAAESNYKNQQSVIAKDEAALTAAYTAYLATQTLTVNAPIDGIIANLTVSPGSSVQAPNATTPLVKPVLVIKNSNDLKGAIQVGQTNIAKVKIGQQAIIHPDAYKDKSYTGTVVRIDTIGENLQGVITYKVYIDIQKDEFLRPGMTFDSDIITQKLTNILTVPNAAVVMENGVKSVRVLQNNKLTYVPVVAGIKGQTRTQILKGLSENQEIIVALTNERAQRPGFLGL